MRVTVRRGADEKEMNVAGMETVADAFREARWTVGEGDIVRRQTSVVDLSDNLRDGDVLTVEPRTHEKA